MSEKRPLPDLASLGIRGIGIPTAPAVSTAPTAPRPTPRATGMTGVFPVPAILAATGASVAATTTDNDTVKPFSTHFVIPRPPRWSR